jgi:hypothetical protein
VKRRKFVLCYRRLSAIFDQPNSYVRYESIPVLTETDIEDLLKKARQFVDEIEVYLKQAGWTS